MASGGLRHMIPTIARTAVAVGIDGIFMEVGTTLFRRLQSQLPMIHACKLECNGDIDTEYLAAMH